MARNIFTRKEGEAPAKRILVLIKGGEIDEEAMRLDYTYALAKIGKGRSVAVDIVYVVAVPHSLPLNAELDEDLSRGERALDHAEHVARDLGLTVETSLLQARSPGAAIVDLANDTEAELIVMATDYQQKLGELDLGRTIPYVLKHARCRVWVCRAPMLETKGSTTP